MSEQPSQEEVLIEKLFTPLTNIAETPKTYLFRPYIPCGKLTAITAIPGVGKTKFGDGLAAHVSSGSALFEGLPCERPGKVIIFSSEDDAVDHRKTVSACGGDLSRVFILSDSDDALDWATRNPLTFSSPIVEAAIKRIRPALVIFDPIQRYFGRIDSNSQTETSTALSPLVKLARKYDCAIVLIGHNGKGNNDSLQQKAIGSTNIIGMMRSMLSVVRDPEHPAENIVIHTKTNNIRGDSIRYKILPIPGDEDYAEVHFIRTEPYTEADYRKAIKQMERLKSDEGITEEDPIVKTIIHLAEQNNGFVRVSRKDLEKAVDYIGDETLTDGLNNVVKKYGNWLFSKRGITIKLEDSARQLKPFTLSGTTILPDKTSARVMTIKQNRYSSP